MGWDNESVNSYESRFWDKKSEQSRNVVEEKERDSVFSVEKNEHRDDESERSVRKSHIKKDSFDHSSLNILDREEEKEIDLESLHEREENEEEVVLRPVKKEKKKEASKTGKSKKAEKKSFNKELSASLQLAVGDLISREDRFLEGNRKIYKDKNYQARLKRLENWENKVEEKGKKKLRYKQRVKLQNDAVNVQMSRVVWDKKRFWIFGTGNDNDAMDTLKKRTILLQNLLRADRNTMKKNGMIDRSGRFDAETFTSLIDETFGSVLAACDNYLDAHKSTHSIWGSRRKKKVAELKKRLLTEQEKYKNTYYAIKLGAYVIKEEEIQSPQDLVENLKTIQIVKADYQTEGNSTDVYLVKVIEEGAEGDVVKSYYMKENLPMIHKDLDGFLKRRTSQLKVSQENKKNTARMSAQDKAKLQTHQLEELRMQKAGADNTDYRNGLKLLNLMQDKIAGSGLEDANKYRERYASFFKHDFDKLFRRMDDENQAIRTLNKARDDQLSISYWEKKAKKEPNAKIIVELLKSQKGKLEKGRKLKEHTPAEWIKKQLGLKKGTDSELISFLNDVDKQANNTRMKGSGGEVQISRLEALFRITMGKEVELYGQVMEGNNGEDAEMAQYNTMATSYLAKKYGFGEEVVSTEIRTGEFTRWDGQSYNGVITLQEIAEGEEWIEVCKRAKRDGKKIRQSAKAVRQLIRLQMFDTLCQQKDRHGRNFKCVTSEDADGNIVVESIRAYDHDQSFSTEDLKSSFKEKKGQNGRLLQAEKNRFLPPTLQVYKKNSVMYRYIANKFFGSGMSAAPEWLRTIKEPQYKDAQGRDIKLDPYMKSYLPIIGFGSKQAQIRGEKNDIHKDYVNPTGIRWMQDTYGESRTWDTERKWSITLNFGNEESEYSRITKRDSGEEVRNNKVRYGEKNDFQKVLVEVGECALGLEDFFMKDESLGKQFRDNMFDKKKSWISDQFMRKPAEMVEKMKEDPKAFKQVVKHIKKLKELNDKYDFSQVTLNCTLLERTCFNLVDKKYRDVFPGYNEKHDLYDQKADRRGLLQAWINEILFIFAKAFSDNPDVVAMLSGTDEVPEAMKDFLNDNGDLEIPSLLHADKEAYDKLTEIITDYEKNTLKNDLISQRITDKAAEAVYKRAVQMKERYDYMARQAEKLLSRKYPHAGADDPRRRFFLTKEDYGKFTDLSDFTIDPGDSYLVQDNEQYLSCQEDYEKLMTEGERTNKLQERQKVMMDSKRWNDEKPERLEVTVNGRIADIKKGRN